MKQIIMTVEEQDVRLESAAKRLDVEIEAKRERVQQLEELAAQQREFKSELEEILVRLSEKNTVLRQKQEALLST